MSARCLRLAALLAIALAAPRPARAQDTPAAGARVVVPGVVVDAATGLPVPFAAVRTSRGARTVAGSAGEFRLLVAIGDTVRVRRLGYREAVALADGGPLRVALAPLAASLAAVRVRADSALPAGRLAVVRDVAALREAGAASTAEALARLPFVEARGARGELALSMRGSRGEQVMVTLDGMPLNDPATGRASVADVPLAALGTVGAAPGADPVAGGGGASGGVVALTSDTASVLHALAGSFGRVEGDAAWSAPVAGGRVRLGASWARARNDYEFRNVAAATGADSVERRVNADERRLAAFASATLPAAQLVVVASDAEQGMVGPMNVRVYDDARARRRRLYARAAAAPGGWAVASSVRAFSQRYRDPRQPTLPRDDGALSLDVEGARAVGALALRAGVGLDRATGTGMERQRRPRGFGAASVAGARGAWRARAGARVDALRGAGAEPSLEAAVERAGAIAPFARVAQAFRAPTLYDLYFASPRLVVARTLRPERVALDAEAGVRARVGGLSLAGSAFARRTHDAIVWFPSGIAGWSPQNVDRERVEGAEGSATWSGRAGELRAWGGRYRTRLFAGPLVLPTPYVPYSSGGASALVRRGALALSATLRLADRRPFAVAPASPQTELPGTALADAALSYRLAVPRGVALLTVGAANLGDVAWQSVRGYPAPGRSWSMGLTIQP